MTSARHAAPVEDALLEARELTLKTGQGRAFGPLDLVVRPSAAHLLAGPSGSGRSAALLALTGRMPGVTGELVVDGIDALAHPGKVRRITSVARLAGLVVNEPKLTVAESLTERCLLDAVSTGDGEMAFTRASDLLGLDVDRSLETERLAAVDQLRLAVALACVRPSKLIIVDDLETNLAPPDVDLAISSLTALAASGPAVIAATLGPHDATLDTTHLPQES
ncbi:ATP-binding cassette domain-containing protein [Propionibacteriaceae bacterium Y1685]|uniref:ATP-binding cassette domain-containing protein n=1 Tax=Microlunatus sp. Y1700 TaxID=3418487 RepID=UPI003B7B85FA